MKYTAIEARNEERIRSSKAARSGSSQPLLSIAVRITSKRLPSNAAAVSGEEALGRGASLDGRALFALLSI